MQTIIYNLLNKFFMNEIENEIIKLLRTKDKIIFDIGCFKVVNIYNYFNAPLAQLDRASVF